MDEKNISFLLRCSKDLKITKNYWHQPIFLISQQQNNLRHLFQKKNHQRLEIRIQEAFSSGNSIIWDEPYEMISPKTNVSLGMLAVEDSVLVYGIYHEGLTEGYKVQIVRDAADGFIRAIHKMENPLVTSDMDTIYKQFEEIQILNNQLVNTQRRLQKSNAKLNHLNRELNNRLVKDELTGLVSRYQYREEIEMTIAKNPDQLGVFVFLDLDRFKQVNDTFGHRAGDEYLKEFARRLKGLPFENFISMRISGDEFGIYIHGYDKVQEEDYNCIWEKIHIQVLERPIMIESQELDVCCSGGMAVYGLHTTNFFDLIEYADFAMYEAKVSKQNTFKAFSKNRYTQKKIAVQ